MRLNLFLELIGGFDMRNVQQGLMTLEFNIIIIAKKAFIPHNKLFRLAHPAGQNMSRQFARQTGARRYEPFMVLLQKFMVNTWLIIKTVNPCLRYQFDQVVVSGHVFCQQHQVAGGGFFFVLSQ